MAMMRRPALMRPENRRSRRSEAKPHWYGSVQWLADQDVGALQACALVEPEAAEVVAELRRFDRPFLRLYLEGEGIADTPEDIARNRQRLHIRRLVPAPEEGPPALKADLVWLWLVVVAVAALSVRRRCRR